MEPLWHDTLPDVDLSVSEIAPEAYARALASHLSGPSVQALLDELRALGKLPDDGN